MTFLLACLLAAPVSIDLGGYTGRYYVDTSSNGPFTIAKSFDLGAGPHYLDFGAFGGGTGFTFNVDSLGNVTAISVPSS